MMSPWRTSILTEVDSGITLSPDKCSDGTCDQQPVPVVVIIQRYTAPANDSVLSIPAARNQAASVTEKLLS
jgi:hypothetical protein